MSFQDIFKSSFLANANAVTVLDMILSFGFSLGMGWYIFLIYKKSYKGVMYDSGFGKTLAVMTMITTILITAVTSNVVLSLGMVGALSIVRFRTAIKDPMEIVFLFWSIETGIVLAAGMIPLAVITNVLLGLVLLALSRQEDHERPFLVVIQCDEEREDQMIRFFGLDRERGARRHALKSRTSRGAGEPLVELVIEVREDAMRKEDFDFTLLPESIQEFYTDQKTKIDIRDICLCVGNLDARSVAAISYDGKYSG